MMDGAVIRKKIDLVIRLLDTTTGEPISEKNTNILFDNQPLELLKRGRGIFICINHERVNFSFSVNVYGYEDKRIDVNYAILDERVPTVEVYLIPKDFTRAGVNLQTLSGRLRGLTCIEAVSLAPAHCFYRGYNARKRVLTLFNPHKLSMLHVYYAILKEDETQYQNVVLGKQISESEILTETDLKEEPEMNAPIVRVVFGQADKNGNYLIRVRDDAAEVRYLVKYTVNGNDRFKVVDFHNLESVKLK